MSTRTQRLGSCRFRLSLAVGLNPIIQNPRLIFGFIYRSILRTKHRENKGQGLSIQHPPVYWLGNPLPRGSHPLEPDTSRLAPRCLLHIPTDQPNSVLTAFSGRTGPLGLTSGENSLELFLRGLLWSTPCLQFFEPTVMATNLPS